MSSLFERKKSNVPLLVTLPTSCAPTEEADDLVRKRQAALRWMQEHGVKYLGEPPERIVPPGEPQLRVNSMRLVNARQQKPLAADQTTPDQAQNG